MKNLKSLHVVLTVSLAIATAAQSAPRPACNETSYKLEKQTSAPDFRRSNVPTCDGRFVSGFQILGDGIKWYADAIHANECFDVDVEFLPADVSALDTDSAVEYLGFEVDVYRRVDKICAR